jgi:hypothetical protein
MSLKFVVPPEEKTVNRYGVWVEGYGFAVRRQLGAAKQTAYNRAGIYGYYWGSKRDEQQTNNRIVITELVDGEWYVLFDVPKGTKFKDLPWVKNTGPKRWDWQANRFVVREEDAEFKAVPMTRDEYAEWRVAVDREQRNERTEVPPNINVWTSPANRL